MSNLGFTRYVGTALMIKTMTDNATIARQEP